jgi:hypothetical protein
MPFSAVLRRVALVGTQILVTLMMEELSSS